MSVSWPIEHLRFYLREVDARRWDDRRMRKLVADFIQTELPSG